MQKKSFESNSTCPKCPKNTRSHFLNSAKFWCTDFFRCKSHRLLGASIIAKPVTAVTVPPLLLELVLWFVARVSFWLVRWAEMSFGLKRFPVGHLEPQINRLKCHFNQTKASSHTKSESCSSLLIKYKNPLKNTVQPLVLKPDALLSSTISFTYVITHLYLPLPQRISYSKTDISNPKHWRRSGNRH